MFGSFKVQRRIASNSSLLGEDVLNTKKALEKIGLYRVPDWGMTPYPDAGMFEGLKGFQRENGLKVDGVMKPEGPTEGKLGEVLKMIGGGNGNRPVLTLGPERKNPLKPIPLPHREGDPEPEMRELPHLETDPKTRIELEVATTVSAENNNNDSKSHKTNDQQSSKYNDGNTVQIVNSEQERIDAISENRKVVFEINNNNNADDSSPWYEKSGAGKSAVSVYEKLIEKESKRQGMDPDIVKAIVYAENARGHYFGLSKAAEGLGLADTIFPMNIDPRKWKKLGITMENSQDPLMNIRAGVTLIKRIQDRIDNPNPEKIASIWNYTGREKVNDFGAYVGRIFREKAWGN